MRSYLRKTAWILICTGMLTGCEDTTSLSGPAGEPGGPYAPGDPTGGDGPKQLPPGMTMADLLAVDNSLPIEALADVEPPPSWESDYGTRWDLGDDDSRSVELGFTFEYYERPYSDIWMNSNGNATFHPQNFAWGPTPIPDDEKQILGVLYGDFNPEAGGAVWENQLGEAPNRRLVITWESLPEYSDAGSNTFQLQLFEGSNAIQFGYNGLTTDGVNDFVPSLMYVGISLSYFRQIFVAIDSGVAIRENLDGTNICFLPDENWDYQVTMGPCFPEPPEVILVDLDIKPGSDENPVNLKSNGVIPAAILGTPDFDVTTVDVTTLAFGPGETAPDHKTGGHLEDANGDGLLDLVSHYRTQESGLAVGDTEACVTGLTLDGIEFEGCDVVAVKDKEEKEKKG